MGAVFVVEYVNRYHRGGLETQAPKAFPLLTCGLQLVARG